MKEDRKQWVQCVRCDRPIKDGRYDITDDGPIHKDGKCP